ncbi:hypothetical protein ACU5AY_02825 [Rhizobium sp. PAMB 3174]
MNALARLTPAAYGTETAETDGIANRLEEARAQIEQRFLEGGTLLVSVLEVFTQLTQVLEKVSGSLKEEEAAEASQELALTASLIAKLPEAQTFRDTRLGEIGVEGQALGREIQAMEETLRYLRTFATTAKITGAHIPDFAGFAVEIIERIQFATKEVKSLSDRIATLHGMIRQASLASGSKMSRHDDDIPRIVADLENNAKAIKAQREALGKVATKITDMAHKVQGRLASSLSALQIGDVTRQRIEHCQAAYSIAEAQIAANAATLGDDGRERLLQAVTKLVHEQINALSSDFSRECSTIVTNIRAFFNDAASLMSLYETLLPRHGGTETTPLTAVKAGLESARGTVGAIEGSAAEAMRLSTSANGVVEELVRSVETIQLVRTDIQYMALNTNLRCGRLGEEGRAINVVTSELRAFSGKLDEAAERALINLRRLEQLAADLQRNRNDETGKDLSVHIDIALAHVTTAADTVDLQMGELRDCGNNVSAQLAAATTGLNFHHGIQDIIAACAERTASARNAVTDLSGLEEIVSAISAQVFKTYTMKSERDVHAHVLGLPETASAAAAPVQQQQDDDDLFEDALF